MALDPPARDIMLRPPHRGGLFTRRVFIDVLSYGFIMGALVLITFSLMLWVVKGGDTGDNCNQPEGTNCEDIFAARGAAFVVFNILLLVMAYNLRDLYRSAYSRSWTKNKVLFYSLVFVTISSAALLYIPYISDELLLHSGFGLAWLLPISMIALFLVLMYLYKRLVWGTRPDRYA